MKMKVITMAVIAVEEDITEAAVAAAEVVAAVAAAEAVAVTAAAMMAADAEGAGNLYLWGENH